jgi:hypothetical protein
MRERIDCNRCEKSTEFAGGSLLPKSSSFENKNLNHKRLIMIYTAMKFLSGVMNDFIALKDPLAIAGGTSGMVALTNIVDQENKLVLTGNRIYMTLVNTEEETVGKSQLPYLRNPDDSLNIVNPDVKLNLYLMFSAHGDVTGDLSAYEASLKLLNEVVLFFQFRNVFKANDHAMLYNGGLDRLIVDPVSLTFEQLNHLWATMGAKYLPSLLYKCRMLTFRETVVSPAQPLVKTIQADEVLKP